MAALAIIGLAISHALFYLVGRAISTNKVLDKHYPEYRRLKYNEELRKQMDEAADKVKQVKEVSSF